MLIDWFTVAAQLVNFAILVWLLKRFLYRPVLAAMAAREQRVRETVAAAERQRADATEEARRLREQRAALEQQKEQMLEAARAEADGTRDQLVARARDEAESRRRQWQESLDREWKELRDDLTRRIGEESLAVARQALRELSGSDLEERIAAAFLERLGGLDEETREQFRSAGDAAAPWVVRSRFDLSEPLRDRLRQGLQRELAVRREIVFETAPEMIAGIEVSADGRRIAWSLDEFLHSLELRIRDRTEPQPTP